MNILEQYNLEFKILDEDSDSRTPVCNLTYNDVGFAPHWEYCISKQLRRAYLNGSVSEQIEDIQSILNGSWNGIEGEDNVYFHISVGELIYDTNDLHAYFDKGTRTDGIDDKMPLSDYKALLEEWLLFIVHNGFSLAGDVNGI